MVDLYLIFMVSFALLIIELLIFKSDYASPAFIYTASFVVCSACALYMAEDWDIEQIEQDTVILICGSLLIFVIVEEITRYAAFILARCKNASLDKRGGGREKQSIEIPNTILNVAIVLALVGIAWSFIYIFRFASAGDWNAMFALYKNTLNTDSASLGWGKKLLNQFNKILVALNYVLLYVFNYNNSCSQMLKKEKRKYIISFILFMFYRLVMVGGRQGLLFFVVAWVTSNLICKTYKVNRHERDRANKKYVKIMLLAVAIIFPAFYFFGRFVGRRETDVMYASTAYLTTGIYGLNWEVRNGYSSAYWGEISFPGLYPILKFFGVIPAELQDQAFLPFLRYGNTVSILGRWYWDFGISGAFVMVGAISFLFSFIFYFKVKYKTDGHKRNISTIIYSYMIYILYFAGYDDFVIHIFSLNFLLIIILICLFYRWIVRTHVKIVFGQLGR